MENDSSPHWSGERPDEGDLRDGVNVGRENSTAGVPLPTPRRGFAASLWPTSAWSPASRPNGGREWAGERGTPIHEGAGRPEHAIGPFSTSFFNPARLVHARSAGLPRSSRRNQEKGSGATPPPDRHPQHPHAQQQARTGLGDTRDAKTHEAELVRRAGVAPDRRGGEVRGAD